LWVDDGIQQYTVATESARLECIGYGAPPELVDVVGIPVRRDFAVAVDRVAVRQQRLTELGLDPARFTILAMAGAEGSPRALANLSGLARLDLDAQLVVICGRNEQLRRRVEALPGRMPRRAVGFVEHVADLMRSADILVTKAGGLTLAEAFCCGVPLVVDDALPGQEAGNLAYVLDAGAAEFGQTPAALARIIPDLMRHPDKRTALVAGGGRLARPAAAREIAANLLRRLDASGA
jgi:processive 1,2-diacylglycerol beta-glucosyltransferase